MEQYTVLSNDEGIGYIMFYEHSGMFTAAFGSVVIDYFPEEFTSFQRMLAYLINQPLTNGDKKTRQYQIPTPNPHLRLFFSKEELFLIFGLFNKAEKAYKKHVLEKYSSN